MGWKDPSGIKWEWRVTVQSLCMCIILVVWWKPKMRQEEEEEGTLHTKLGERKKRKEKQKGKKTEKEERHIAQSGRQRAGTDERETSLVLR